MADKKVGTAGNRFAPPAARHGECMEEAEVRPARRETAMMPRTLRNYLQHRLNPAHLYCRLRDIGLAKARARRMISVYAKIYSLTWLA